MNENVFIAKNQDLDVNEQKRNDILSFIESFNDFQDFIKKLKEENLIWYFVGPLHEDEEVKKQINSKWKREFEQSVDAIHKKFEALLPDQSFLAYSTKSNDFNIRLKGEKSVKISDILKASSEGEVYSLSLGKDSQITACEKNGNERHYNLAGSGSCEMTINWQAKDFKGNGISCSIIVEMDSSGIKRVVNEPKFGDLKFTDSLPEEKKDKILKLIEQNKEVFINGKALYQAFTEMGRSMDSQQGNTQPQPSTPSSSGYSSPSSRRSSVSTTSKFSDEDETFESDTSDDEEEHKQGGKGLEDRVVELEKENTYLKKENTELKSHNTKIIQEDDEGLNKLTEEKQDLGKEVTRLKNELKRKEKELAEKNQDIEQLKQQIIALDRNDKNAKVVELNNQLKDKESEVQSTHRINAELQKKLDQDEIELSKLKAENTELINITKRILETDNNEKRLVEELKEKIDNLVKELNEVNIKNKDLEGELERKNEDSEMKIQQPEPGRSLADELSEVGAEVATSTQTEVEYESRGIEASDHETTFPKTQDQDTQAADKSSSKRISKLGKENKSLARDKLTISEQLKQKTKDIDELKKNLKQLQEENTQLKQRATKGTGVDASFLTDQKETKEMEVQTDLQMKDSYDLYDIKNKHIKTTFKDVSVAPAKVPEKSTPSK